MAGTYLDQRMQSARKRKRALAAFDASMARVEGDLDARHERDRARCMCCIPTSLRAYAPARSSTACLWARRPEHPEFLQVRLGVGDIPAVSRLKPPRTSRYRRTS